MAKQRVEFNDSHYGLYLIDMSSKGLTIPSSRSGYGLNISISTSNMTPPFNSTLTMTAEEGTEVD